MEKTLVNGTIKPCCQDQANLEFLADESQKGLVVKRCRVCGCRHRRLVVEPGMFGMSFKAVPRSKT